MPAAAVGSNALLHRSIATTGSAAVTSESNSHAATLDWNQAAL
jgi:hypothetical protein